MARGCEDHGDTSFIVGAEEGFAAGRDDIVAERGAQPRGILERERLRRIIGQHDGLAGVGAMDERPSGAGEIGGGIDVGAPRDDGYRMGDGGGQGGEDETGRRERDLAGTERAKFSFEQAQERPLAGSARRRRAGGIAACVDLDVAEETRKEVSGVDHASDFQPTRTTRQT